MVHPNTSGAGMWLGPSPGTPVRIVPRPCTFSKEDWEWVQQEWKDSQLEYHALRMCDRWPFLDHRQKVRFADVLIKYINKPMNQLSHQRAKLFGSRQWKKYMATKDPSYLAAHFNLEKQRLDRRVQKGFVTGSYMRVLKRALDPPSDIHLALDPTGTVLSGEALVDQAKAVYTNFGCPDAGDPVALQTLLHDIFPPSGCHRGQRGVQFPWWERTDHATLPDVQLTLEGLDAMLRKASMKTAAGYDGLPLKALRKCTDIVKQAFLLPCCALLSGEMDFPKHWNRARITLIPKPGNTMDLRNKRPISVLSCIYKVVATALAGHIDKYLPSHPRQFGFKPGHSTDHAKVRMLHLLVPTKERKFVVFLDLFKAFPSMKLPILSSILAHRGAPDSMLSLLRRLYAGAEDVIVLNKQDKFTRPYTYGAREGCPASPHLFGALMDVVLQTIETRLSGVVVQGRTSAEPGELGFADDLAAVIKEVDIPLLLDTMRMLEHVLGVKFNVPKCKFIPIGFPSSLLTQSRDTARWELRPGEHLTPVPRNGVYPYLGSLIPGDLQPSTANEHIHAELISLLSKYNQYSIPFLHRAKLVNMAVIPMLRHRMFCIPRADKFVDQIQTLLERFVRNNSSCCAGVKQHMYYDTLATGGMGLHKLNVSLWHAELTSLHQLGLGYKGDPDPLWATSLRLAAAGQSVQCWPMIVYKDAATALGIQMPGLGTRQATITELMQRGAVAPLPPAHGAPPNTWCRLSEPVMAEDHWDSAVSTLKRLGYNESASLINHFRRPEQVNLVFTDGSLKDKAAGSGAYNATTGDAVLARTTGPQYVLRAEWEAVEGALNYLVTDTTTPTLLLIDNKTVATDTDSMMVNNRMPDNVYSKAHSDVIDRVMTRIRALPQEKAAVWVKAHVQIYGNERADRLAKRATHYKSAPPPIKLQPGDLFYNGQLAHKHVLKIAQCFAYPPSVDLAMPVDRKCGLKRMNTTRFKYLHDRVHWNVVGIGDPWARTPSHCNRCNSESHPTSVLHTLLLCPSFSHHLDRFLAMFPFQDIVRDWWRSQPVFCASDPHAEQLLLLRTWIPSSLMSLLVRKHKWDLIDKKWSKAMLNLANVQGIIRSTLTSGPSIPRKMYRWSPED
jgi:ribonuclease HI